MTAAGAVSEHVLAGDLRVRLRLIGPGDGKDLNEGFQRLSKETILHRFLEPIKRLTPAQLCYLTQIDNREHLALCAVIDEGGTEHGIGVARYVSQKCEPAVAEFAIVVTDEYQNRGVGQLLLARLVADAGRNGIRTLRGYVRNDNLVMARIAKKYGSVARTRADGVTVVEFPAEIP